MFARVILLHDTLHFNLSYSITLDNFTNFWLDAKFLASLLRLQHFHNRFYSFETEAMFREGDVF